MIGIRSAFSIRARGHRPHLEAVYMTAPRSVCRNTKKALPTGGRPYMMGGRACVAVEPVIGRVIASHQPALHHRRLNEGRKQRMRFERSRLQFGMKLHPDEPGVVLVFNAFRQHAIRGKTGELQPVLLEAVLVGGIDLVTMAV